MSDATPQFLITNAGLAVASVATPTGPWINITSFQVGSAYGYTPQVTDTGLNGNLLYQGAPTAYQSVGNNTIDIICDIPPDAGPFEFGEVGIFLEDGTMFAKAVFDSPQTKFSALGTNVVSSYTFNCLLKLQQSVAVFQITTNNGPPSVFEVYNWSDVFPPGISANPDIPLYLIRELSESGDSTLLQNSTDELWTIGTTYNPYLNKTGEPGFPVVNATTTWVQIAANQLNTNDITTVNRRYVLRTPDGYFRSVLSIIDVGGGNYQLNLNCNNDGTYTNTPLPVAPQVGSHVYLFIDGRFSYNNMIGPPPVTAGPGLYSVNSSTLGAAGLLHYPSQNTGTVITTDDQLDNPSLPSGVYYTTVPRSGLSANKIPGTAPGTIIVQNLFNSANIQSVSQTFYPTGSLIETDNNTDFIYYRTWKFPSWSKWFQVALNEQGTTNENSTRIITYFPTAAPFGGPNHVFYYDQTRTMTFEASAIADIEIIYTGLCYYFNYPFSAGTITPPSNGENAWDGITRGENGEDALFQINVNGAPISSYQTGYYSGYSDTFGYIKGLSTTKVGLNSIEIHLQFLGRDQTGNGVYFASGGTIEVNYITVGGQSQNPP
jgi:hypothetical protein